MAIAVPVRRLFTHAVAPTLGPALEPGSRVRVPFGPRKVVGTVVEWPAPPPGADVEVRPIESVVAGSPALPAPILELTRFVADYYLCSWGEAIEAALPPEPGAGPRPRFARRLPAADAGSLSPRATALQSLLASLPEDGRPVSTERLAAPARRALRQLVARGLVELCAAPPDPAETPAEPPPAEAGPPPTAAQLAVLAEIAPALAAGSYRPFLLYGAPGSGK